MHRFKDLFTISTINTMKTISTNIAPQDFEPKGKENDKYYLMAMLGTVIVLFIIAYYDHILGAFIK